MNCHQRTTAALNLERPDRVPLFSCTEAQNQIYEILCQEGEALPLSFVQTGPVGLLLRHAAPLVNAVGIFNRFGESGHYPVEGVFHADCLWLSGFLYKFNLF